MLRPRDLRVPAGVPTPLPGGELAAVVGSSHGGDGAIGLAVTRPSRASALIQRTGEP